MRVPDVTLRVGDRLPTVVRTVAIDGTAIDLTGMTAKFIMQNDSGAALIDAAGIVDSDQVANRGRVSYLFSAADASVPAGTYYGWFDLTSGSTNLTAPNDGFLVVSIVADRSAIWSYTGQPGTRPIDAVRFLAGETDPANQRVSDAEILFLLGENNADAYMAAADVADQLASYYTGQVVASKSVGDLSLTYSYAQSSTTYQALAARLRARSMRYGLTGISAGGIDAPSIFSIGMLDVPGSERPGRTAGLVMVDASLVGLMASTVTWYPKTGFGTYGARSYASIGTTIRGRLGVGKATKNASSADTTEATFWCDGVYAIGSQDKIVLPDGSTPDIVKVETFHDENGPYFTKLTLADS